MVQVTDTIVAKQREASNKGAARKLRAANLVPAVAYGPGSEPRNLSLDPKDFVLQRQKFGLSHIYDVQVEGGATFKALIKDIQQDPISRAAMHVDLYEVDMTKPIRVIVPIELTGKPAGFIDGGLLSQVLRSTEVQCLPNLVPSKLVGDVSPLKVGDSLHLSNLPLPEGVKITAHNDEAVALLVEPDAAPVEPAPGAAAAAPAAGAAAPAAPAKK